MRISLSEHTLDINRRRCDVVKFDWAEVEEYVRALCGERSYQVETIRDLMVYLWGGSYKDITALAKENYQRKQAIQQRFHSEEHFLRMLPLPDKLSGVCHLATGTGKSYVMFAVAYLSLLLGKVKRVLVLGPSSTVIEEGLREKFKEHLYGGRAAELKPHLPPALRHKVIRLITCNDAVEDGCIMIENINAVYLRERNALGDWFAHNPGEVLVLSDEVHHAYSHLTLSGEQVGYDFTEQDLTKKSEASGERLWMKFIREEKAITRHIGFTGTPYNQNDYFPDVLCNYSIRDAMEEKIIKKINPILKTETDEGDGELTRTQRFEMIIQTHQKNRQRFAYPDKQGRHRIKPITIFINPTQKTAKDNAEEFVKVLADTLRADASTPRSVLESQAREKVLVVVSELSASDYQQKLNEIEQTDPALVGGAVEFLFAVNKLSEGWDVDNVFQIVPAEEKVFNSKLLISQVLGRGLRLPREVPAAALFADYPTVTITNHERFADHIKELLDEVTECELRLKSGVLPDSSDSRGKHHFSLFNLDYIPVKKLVDKDPDDDPPPLRELILTPSAEKLGLKVTYLQETRRFELSKDFFTLDQIVLDVARRLRNSIFEAGHFDFGDGIVVDGIPGEEEVQQVIRNAMQKAGMDSGDKLSRENRQQIELFFNRYLPRGRKKPVYENVEGNLHGISTLEMPHTSMRAGALEQDACAFVSEHWQEELSGDNQFIMEELTKGPRQMTFDEAWLRGQGYEPDHLRQLSSFRHLYAANTSLLRTPQELVLTRYEPERQFMFRLIANSKYLRSWIKSPDSGFYGLDYEYWKQGKSRTHRTFNPDFFLRLHIADYLLHLTSDPSDQSVSRLRLFQDKGIEDLILAVEIKHDDDDSDMTQAKEKAGLKHFQAVNRKLRQTNPADLPVAHRPHYAQHYAFKLLRPEDYNNFFGNLRTGLIVFDTGSVTSES
jgi:type III restriction enzyme